MGTHAHTRTHARTNSHTHTHTHTHTKVIRDFTRQGFDIFHHHLFDSITSSINPAKFVQNTKINFHLLLHILLDILHTGALLAKLGAAPSPPARFLLLGSCCLLLNNLHSLLSGSINTALHSSTQLGSHTCPSCAGQGHFSFIKIQSSIRLHTLFREFSRRSCCNKNES